jgi:hypothetical protein
MNNFSKTMKQFFEIAKNAIEHENQTLNKIFIDNENTKFYKKTLPNFTHLCNCNISYVIYKSLVENNFPYFVSWESSYPEENFYTDFLIKQSNDILASVKLIRWTTKKSIQIKHKIEKSKIFSGNIQKYVIIFWEEELNDNFADWLHVDMKNYYNVHKAGQHSFEIYSHDYHTDNIRNKKAVIVFYGIE